MPMLHEVSEVRPQGPVGAQEHRHAPVLFSSSWAGDLRQKGQGDGMASVLMAKQGVKDLHDLDEFRDVIFQEGVRGKGFADVLTAMHGVEGTSSGT